MWTKEGGLLQLAWSSWAFRGEGSTREKKFSLQTREVFVVLIILGWQAACFHVLIYWLCKKKIIKKKNKFDHMFTAICFWWLSWGCQERMYYLLSTKAKIKIADQKSELGGRSIRISQINQEICKLQTSFELGKNNFLGWVLSAWSKMCSDPWIWVLQEVTTVSGPRSKLLLMSLEDKFPSSASTLLAKIKLKNEPIWVPLKSCLI